MRQHLLVVLSFTATILCWGIYGPLLHWGGDGMAVEGGPALLRPFVCVGLAYFAIAVIVPIVLLRLRGEPGQWSMTGIIWSLAAGAAGAIGALGLLLAFHFGGRPIYVLPLAFCGATVVNTFLTIGWGKTKSKKQLSWVFGAGLIMVLLGAAFLLIFKPAVGNPVDADHDRWFRFVWQIVCIALTIAGWGAYGPILHKGQAAMRHSRLRPFLCLGLAYFAIAVVVPYLMLLTPFLEQSTYTFIGTSWSLLAGAAGAVGALGIIMAFSFGGRPVFVMPLVFGGVPVVNSFWAIVAAGKTGEVGPIFMAGLILVLAGSVMVLIFAPRDEAAPHGKAAKKVKTPPKKQDNAKEPDANKGEGDPTNGK